MAIQLQQLMSYNHTTTCPVTTVMRVLDDNYTQFQREHPTKLSAETENGQWPEPMLSYIQLLAEQQLDCPKAIIYCR